MASSKEEFPWAGRRGFNTTVTAVLWALWKQRNARVFNRVEQQKNQLELVTSMLLEIAEWRQAAGGVGGLQHFVRS